MKGWFQEIWGYRELLYFFVWRDIKIRYKQTALGAMWAIIQPFFTMVIFTVFFGKLAKIPSEGIPYPIFYYTALVPWTYFSVALSFSANSLVSNSHLLTKIYFPRLVLPASPTIGGLLDFGIASILLIGLMLFYKVPLSWGLLLWPVIVIPLLFLALGLGMIFASINVKYRDVKYAIPFFIQLMLFLTPIIYPTNIIPGNYRLLMLLNPLAGIIDAFRSSVHPSRHIEWGVLTLSVAITALVFLIGLLYFKRTERAFADII